MIKTYEHHEQVGVDVKPTLAEYKNALGHQASKMSDEEINRSYVLSERIASTLFSCWSKRFSKISPVNNAEIR